MNPNTPLITEVADYLQSALGMTVYIGELPESKTDGVFCFQIAGPPPHLYLDTETNIIDFWVRSNDTLQAYADLKAVYSTFHRKENYQLTNWYVYFSYAGATIRDEDRDREGNKLLALTINFICRNANNIS